MTGTATARPGKRPWLMAALLGACVVAACGPAAEAGSPTALPPTTTRLSVGAPIAPPSDNPSDNPTETAKKSNHQPRYGLNLGGPSAWGAEQLLANAVANPGFEAVLDRSLVVVEAVGPQQLQRSTGWNTRPTGFWRQASGEVLTGAHAGTVFQVVDDTPAASERALLRLSRALPDLRPGDVVSLQTTPTTAAPARWWAQGGVATAVGTAPGSAGHQVARLEAAVGQPTVLSSYIDTLERAGRMLPVNGAWELRLTARSVGAQHAQLRVRVAREGGEVFIDQVVSPGAEWQHLRLPFRGLEPTTGKGTLSLSFSLVQGGIEMDDVYLGESAAGAGGFRQVVVDTLRQLKPGYLREWQGQLGDTTTNRLADDTARRPVRYRPGDSEVLHTYSVNQTMALCQAVGARPWLVLPTTLGAAEAFRYGQAVRQLAGQYQLDQVVVEFGNENWNPLFGAAGFVSAPAHAAAAQRALTALQSGFGQATQGSPALVTMVNARLDDLPTVAKLGQLSAVDRISVAPYFAYRFNEQHTLAEQWASVWAETTGADLLALAGAVKGSHAQLSAYELNLHTTEGDAEASRRNALVAGAASGPALAKRLLQGSLAGMAEQAVYALAGFDAFAGNGDLVRLFGITRDLAWAGHLRPTGIALAMLNEVAGGRAHTAPCTGPACGGMTAVAFVSDRPRWAIVNSDATTQAVRVAQACTGQALQASLLDGHDLWLNNETAPMVAPSVPATRCEGSDLLIDIPPRSLVTLR
jgi:hypothetical protein